MTDPTAPVTERPERPLSRVRLIGQFAAALVLGTVVAVLVLYVPPAGWTTNEVITGKHPGYPDLKPHVYDMAPGHCVLFAAEAARRLGWRVLETRPDDGTMTALARGFPLPAEDTVTVTAAPDPANAHHTVVEIRGRAPFGPGDLGANARHIRDLQAWMDDKLPKAR